MNENGNNKNKLTNVYDAAVMSVCQFGQSGFSHVLLYTKNARKHIISCLEKKTKKKKNSNFFNDCMIDSKSKMSMSVCMHL